MRIPRFREANPVRIAVIGVVGTLLAVAGSFQAANLPIVAGPSYQAEFADGGGMEPGAEVWVAGTPVGKVTEMELDGDKVLVTFTAKGIDLGDQTRAAIKTGSLLGKRYLGLEPAGDEPMGSGSRIPLARTTAPYNISYSLERVTQQVGEIDQPQLKEALNTFADAFENTPESFAATLRNVRRLSETLSSRDEALRTLLAHANSVTAVLTDRVEQIRTLVQDANVLLAELHTRRAVITRLIDNLTFIAGQVSALVDENYDELLPELEHLNGLLEVLRENNANISLSIDRVAGFISGLGEGIAGSPAFSAMITLGLGVVSFNDYLPQLAGAPTPGPAPFAPITPPTPDPAADPAGDTDAPTSAVENPPAEPKAPALPALPSLVGDR